MKNVVIVGPANGTGLATLKQFIGQNDNVLLIDSLAHEIFVSESDQSGRLIMAVQDLADPDAPQTIIDKAIAEFGSLDCLVVTASVMHSAALAEWTVAKWDALAAVNLRLPFLIARAAAPYLARSDNPSILFLSSTAGLRGSAGAAPFQMAKAALPALARSLTAELGPRGIRVNCIMPGWIETEFSAPYWAAQPDPAEARAMVDNAIPLGHHGQADDVASMIVFLASPAGRYIAGASIVIDGGYTAT